MDQSRGIVVRVEEARGTVQFKEETFLLGDNTRENSSLLSEFSHGKGCLKTGNADPAEGAADGWPEVPKLFQRRSCQMTKAMSTCVNKATSHLELLQNIIEEWCKEVETDIISRASSCGLSRGPSTNGILHSRGAGSSRRQLRFAGSSASTVHTKPPSANLAVQGFGGHVSPSGKEEEFEIPYLGAEEVIDEVLALLARLDQDRQDTLNMLHREQDRVKNLGGQINSLSIKRLRELPLAVQKEHEACSLDINELQWHVSYRGRIESRIKNKVAIAEVLNTRLNEDIGFVKKHCPLVEEKLDLEVQAMEKIRSAQTDTNDELESTMARCSKVQVKSEEAHSKANAERAHIKADLDSVRDQLKKISEELAEAKMTHNTYIHLTSEYREQVKVNQQDIQVLEVKNENSKAAENMKASQVASLQSKIVQEEFEHKRLVEENTTLQESLDRHRSKNRKQEQDLDTALEMRGEERKKMVRKNQDREMDIDDYIKKINECERQKVADQKNLDRMAKELERTEGLIKVTQEDLDQVMIINNAIRDKLRAEEEKCIQSEEALKSTAESLKKQVREEIHTRTMLKARINSDTGEMSKTEEETKQKKEKFSKKVDEVTGAVNVVFQKVERLRSAHTSKAKNIENLKQKIKDLEKNGQDLQADTDNRKGVLMPHYSKLKEELLAHEKRLDYMAHRKDLMNKKMEDMAASTKMMTRVTENTQKAIDELKDELDELTIQFETGQKMEDDLRNSLNDITSRINSTAENQKTHMESRSEVLKKEQQELKESLSKNRKLASKYRWLQNQLMELKNHYANKYDERVKMESSIKDAKQLQGLQKRMRTAMLEYYKYRGQYNQSELSRMEGESGQNSTKVIHLQSEMDNALDHISQFLKDQMQGNVAHKLAMEKVEREQKLGQATTTITA